MEITTHSPRETQEVGRKLSADLKTGDVVAFSGDLGAGKTTFIQGMAGGLGVKSRINSPSFIIMRSYDNFFHVDLYRLEKNLEKEVKNLGLLDIIREGKSIIVIEWAEKIKELLPSSTKWVTIENLGDEKRKIIL